jgi:hypothetical protein
MYVSLEVHVHGTIYTPGFCSTAFKGVFEGVKGALAPTWLVFFFEYNTLIYLKNIMFK